MRQYIPVLSFSSGRIFSIVLEWQIPFGSAGNRRFYNHISSFNEVLGRCVLTPAVAGPWR
ncbi:hypothetical protein Ate02nite_82770 [Paractinoplanes tereljensis]|uniref:Uncharacterized protein n=1 Tax=Paractinoplanes tereljensis TaxID=571912 RepID=A0A919NXL5_9ACTN|nr:hypothetical protein Ate02nite_82770 [Actinoplanes tereljensis]